MKNFIKELIHRWKAESPTFWKKIMKLSITLGTAAAGILFANTQFNLTSYGVSPIVFTVCAYVIVWCGALGLAAKLTIKN